MVDLRRVEFVDAHGLVGIALQVDAAMSAGRDVRVVLPVDGGVQRYLSRMGLRDYLERVGFTGDELPGVHHRDHSARLAELTQCTRESDFTALAELVYHRVAQPGYYPELAPLVYEGIMELAGNVLEHSGSSGGFVAAQTYKVGRPGEYLVFAVGDVGVGIRASLAAEHHPDDDRHALRLAIESGVSGTADSARGYGLSTIVERALELGGSTLITSGTATANIGRWGFQPSDSAEMVGTIVGCRISCQPGA